MADDVKFKSYCFEVGLDPHIVIDPDLVNAYYLSLDSNGNSYIKKQVNRLVFYCSRYSGI